MKSSLKSRLNVEFQSDLDENTLVAATPAWLGMKGTTPWMVVGMIGGTLVDLLLNTDLRWVFLGVGGGVGVSLGMYLADRNAWTDLSHPGGSYVILGVTSDELVLVGRSLWSMKPLRIEARRPLSEISSIDVRKSRGAPTVTFQFSDGNSWRYEVNKWKDFKSALPDGLLKPQPDASE